MNSSPQDPHQPQQWDYRQFNFAYPTRGALHDDPPVQFPLQQQQVQHTQYQPYPQQFPLQPAPYGPAQTSNTAANMNHNSDIPTHNPTNVDSPPPVSLPSAVKRKRATKTAITTPLPSAGSDSSDSENVSGEFGGTGTSACVGDSASPSKAPRLRGACTNCKKLKMKCNFRTSGIASPADTCDRCHTARRTCIVEGRKPRSAPVKREYLLAQLRHKDAIIESLLKQLHNPYLATPLSIESYRMATSPSDTTNRNILTWLDRLQSSVRTGNPSDITAANFPSPSVPASGAKHPNHEDKYGVSTALPGVGAPFGLIANMSLSLSRHRELDGDEIGVANAGYFLPGPATDLIMRAHLIEEYSPPEILVHGLVLPEDVEKLFEIFYNRVNPFVALLDPVLHTPASTFARCPFLFTVVCAISSRYYPPKSEIYPIAMHFARHSAVNALIDGWKSVELCQAYILMSIYSVPARKWEEDRSWLYVGLAIRIATDLNLHEPGQNSQIHNAQEKQERELLNGMRVWMICSIADRSMAAQFGKPTTVSENSASRYRGDDWYRNSPYNNSYDIHMCAHADLLRVMAAFSDDLSSDSASTYGSGQQLDLRTVTMAHDAKLTAFTAEWSQRFAQESDTNDRRCVMRCKLLPFLVAYSRLVMFSVGFQHAYEGEFQSTDRIFFTKCFDSATAVVRNLIESLTPTGFMHYSPDGHFFRAAFAAAFLLKLLQPEFAHMMSDVKESQVYDLIGRLIQTLSSQDIAIDDHHIPKLYARFLSRLVLRHRRDTVTLRTQPPPPHPNLASSSSSKYQYQSHSGSGSTFAHPGAGTIISSGDCSHSYGYTYAHSVSMATPIFNVEGTYSDSSRNPSTMHPKNMVTPDCRWPEYFKDSHAFRASDSAQIACQLLAMQNYPSPVFDDRNNHAPVYHLESH